MQIENPVLMLTRNCLELTKKAVASVVAQDIPIKLMIIDNGSTDGTFEWLHSEPYPEVGYWKFSENMGVSWAWNAGLRTLLGSNFACPYVLVINNDVILPPWFYRRLLEYMLLFVSGISVGNMDEIATEPHGGELSKHPDFSAFLVRRDAWEIVGPFNGRMKHYASDNAWHVEAHRKGVDLKGAPIPFYHERSSTLKLASPEERAEIEAQANRDRAVFRELYGCNPWDKEYEDLFK